MSGKIALKKLKTKNLNTIYHPETKLVFKSMQEKVVVGVYDEATDSLLPLDDEAVGLCEKWKFGYEIPEDDEEGGEEEEEEEEEVVTENNEVEHDPDTVVSDAGENVNKDDEVVPVIKVNNPKKVQDVVKSQYKKEGVRKLSSGFQATISSLLSDFDSRIGNVEDEYIEEILHLRARLEEKTNDYNNVKLDYDNVKSDHDKLKMKFASIKNLIS